MPATSSQKHSSTLLTRRQFGITTLSTVASCMWPAKASSAVFKPNDAPIDPETAIRIIDCARDITESAEKLRNAGIQTVIRYYAREGGQWCGKTLSLAESKAIDAAGLSTAVVFQNENNHADFFYDPNKKKLDAAAALDHASKIVQPKGTPIYFGADFDLIAKRKKDAHGNFIMEGEGDNKHFVMEWSREILMRNQRAILEYFKYVKTELRAKGYKVGVYGCGATCNLLSRLDDPIVDYVWLSASVGYLDTAKFYNLNPKRWHLFQNWTELRSDWIPKNCSDSYGRNVAHKDKVRVIDSNILNPNFEDFGQWRRDGSRPPHSRAASEKVLKSRVFARKKLVRLRAPAGDRPGELLPESTAKISYAKNARVLRDHGDYVAVSLNETDSVAGYCLRDDLTADLNQMPPWLQPRSQPE